MNYFNFNSRETYIVAAAQWKADYAELSQKIRDTRKLFNDAQRAYAKVQYGKSSWAEWKEVEKFRSEKASLRDQATYMISDRISMKEMAQAQYEEAKQAA